MGSSQPGTRKSQATATANRMPIPPSQKIIAWGRSCCAGIKRNWPIDIGLLLVGFLCVAWMSQRGPLLQNFQRVPYAVLDFDYPPGAVIKAVAIAFSSRRVPRCYLKDTDIRPPMSLQNDRNRKQLGVLEKKKRAVASLPSLQRARTIIIR